MNVAATSLAAAFALVVSASAATSTEYKTWYVYCEGANQSEHWAVFSENFWGHPATEGYGRRVGSAAKDFFEARHDVRLEGCAAVNFVDFTLAEHSRNRTAQLHKSMGDRVFYFRLPDDALPTDVARASTPAAEVRTAVAQAKAAEPARSAAPAEVRLPFTPKRSER